MARVIHGTANITATGGTAQLNTDSYGRVMVFSAHARAGNAGTVYIGSDSNVSSASGWELGANEEVTWRYKDYNMAASIPPSDHWIAATDTSQKVDYMFIVEN